jgi:23S rRNA pseudouridine1911/1915/1917 synthase
MKTHKFTVSLKDSGKRLDSFLAEQSGVSRSYVQQLTSTPSKKVRYNEEYTLEIPEAKPLDLTPWDFPLDVVFENDALLVINKPVGLTVHPAAGNWEKTLVHALLHHCAGKLSGINGVERPGIVHRLDKDTSGLMVAAKSDDAHKMLAGMIESREIKREYKAIVCGMPNANAGIIETQIGRDRRNRKKMAVLNEGGKTAVTEYRVAQVLHNGAASIVECKLQTGRTHQIRVHMQHIGCPIVGDNVYGARKALRQLPDSFAAFPRQALHAFRLTIPEIGEFEAELPEDMERLVTA